MRSLPASARHVQSEYASSIAMVAPLADVGTNGWQESPSCTTRPRGDTHCGFGLRQMSFQFTQRLFGVALINAATAGVQPSASRTYGSASEAGQSATHRSLDDASSDSLWVRSQQIFHA